MRDKNIKIFCVTDKVLKYHKKLPYIYAGVGKALFPSNYLLSNNLVNINHKEKYYSELTFQYWFWKNKLNKVKKNTWIGFCQKRRFWIKKNKTKSKINLDNVEKNVIYSIPKEWKEKESVICDPIYVNNVKKIKLLKRGLRSIIQNPEILFNIKKQTLKLHFDMHHGYGNLDKAIDLMNSDDKDEFKKFVNTSTSFNPHIMFIAKPTIAKKWFAKLFSWLFRCEKVFGFHNLSGYDTTRLYAYLAERYLSFWFKKYTKYIEWPVVTLPL
jgi:hypothetical protein